MLLFWLSGNVPAFVAQLPVVGSYSRGFIRSEPATSVERPPIAKKRPVGANQAPAARTIGVGAVVPGLQPCGAAEAADANVTAASAHTEIERWGDASLMWDFLMESNPTEFPVQLGRGSSRAFLNVRRRDSHLVSRFPEDAPARRRTSRPKQARNAAPRGRRGFTALAPRERRHQHGRSLRGVGARAAPRDA